MRKEFVIRLQWLSYSLWEVYTFTEGNRAVWVIRLGRVGIELDAMKEKPRKRE